MKQFNPDTGRTIPIDFNNEKYAESIRTLRPLVYEADHIIHCILGPDKENGVYAQGSSIPEVLMLWDDELKKRIISNTLDRELNLYITESMNASVNKTG